MKEEDKKEEEEEGRGEKVEKEVTSVQNNEDPRHKYWATRSSVRSIARTAHLFACSTLHASPARSAAPNRSLAKVSRGGRDWQKTEEKQ